MLLFNIILLINMSYLIYQEAITWARRDWAASYTKPSFSPVIPGVYRLIRPFNNSSNATDTELHSSFPPFVMKAPGFYESYTYVRMICNVRSN